MTKRLISVSAFLVLIVTGAASHVPNRADALLWREMTHGSLTPADDQRGACEASSDLQGGSTTEQIEATSSPASSPERYVVFFDADTVMISEAVEVILCQAAMDARAKNVPRVRIIRSTDLITQGNTEDTLAHRRTETVRDVLVGQGVPSEVIEISSNGERYSLLSADADMRDLYARRVVVVVDRPHRGPFDNVSLRLSVEM